MSEILLLQERVKNTIQLGESHIREFKSAWEGAPENKKPRPVKEICRDIAEALVSFANADGGELIVGVEDDGTITGVPHDGQALNQMLFAYQTYVHSENQLPLSIATKLECENQTLVFFSVLKGTTEIYQLSDGRCVRRKDKVSIPVAIKQIVFERQETRSRECDRQFVDGATVNDLDVALIQSIADNHLRGLSVERYLQQTGLAEYSSGGLRLRMAALLLFAKDIQRWHPRCQVRILKVVGTQLKSGENYNVKSDQIVRGNIFDLIPNAWEQLRPFLADKTEFGTDAKFEQKYLYPEGASREALINALAHRDYSVQNGIEVFIFDDRMEIKSPGALLSTLTIEDLQGLQGAHESRNAFVAKVLSENKYMRELGEGIKRMFELMEQSELDKPVLYSNSTSFSVTLNHKSVFSTQQEQWLQLYDSLDLSPRQKKIIVLGMDGRDLSPNDIYRAMNTDDRNTYDREVTGLRKANVLIEIRTNVQAQSYARNNKIKKGEVPRFKVAVPESTHPDKPKPRGNAMLKDAQRCVFIYNLPFSSTPEDLKKVFERYGEVEQVVLPVDHLTQRPRGFGFVWYYSRDAAQKALRELSGVDVNGRTVFVREYEERNR
ncbi:MAG: hypothetical protein FJ030_01140 [Chloroflexi bacterium]|nr:hypothetical protein [Chloroflexota bacterium]